MPPSQDDTTTFGNRVTRRTLLPFADSVGTRSQAQPKFMLGPIQQCSTIQSSLRPTSDLPHKNHKIVRSALALKPSLALIFALGPRNPTMHTQKLLKVRARYTARYTRDTLEKQRNTQRGTRRPSCFSCMKTLRDRTCPHGCWGQNNSQSCLPIWDNRK